MILNEIKLCNQIEYKAIEIIYKNLALTLLTMKKFKYATECVGTKGSITMIRVLECTAYFRTEQKSEVG